MNILSPYLDSRNETVVNKIAIQVRDFRKNIRNTENIRSDVFIVVGISDNLPVTTVTSTWAFAFDVDLGAVWRLSSAPVRGLNVIERNGTVYK